MKLLKPFNFAMCFLLVGLMVLTGCTDKSALLAKTWKLQDLRYKSQVPEGLKATVQKSIDQIKSAYTITYEPNGKYYTHMGEETAKGTWQLNMTSTKIISTTDVGIKTEFKIDELTDHSFTFEAKEGKDVVIFVMVPAK